MADIDHRLIPAEFIERRIYLIRRHKVMIDSDFAALYGVSTKRLNEQVRRNRKRFPPDFMFELNDRETKALRSQIATSNRGRGGRRYRPMVFTEQGVAINARWDLSNYAILNLQPNSLSRVR